VSVSDKKSNIFNLTTSPGTQGLILKGKQTQNYHEKPVRINYLHATIHQRFPGLFFNTRRFKWVETRLVSTPNRKTHFTVISRWFSLKKNPKS